MDGTDSSRESSVWPVAGGRWYLVVAVAVVSEGRWRRWRRLEVCLWLVAGRGWWREVGTAMESESKSESE